MNTRCRQSQQRRTLETNLLGLCVAMALAAPAILTTPSAATAAPITYNFSPSVMGPVPGGVDTITGTFTFDPTGSPFGATLNSASLTVTGPTNPGTYTPFPPPPPVLEPGNEIDLVSGGATMSIIFANNLGLTPDNVTQFIFNAPNLIRVTATQGTAVPAAPAVPEPTSLALLGGALGLFLLKRRADRR
jgi:hypothetical protein